MSKDVFTMHSMSSVPWISFEKKRISLIIIITTNIFLLTNPFSHNLQKEKKEMTILQSKKR